jgi:hypothetical protein
VGRGGQGVCTRREGLGDMRCACMPLASRQLPSWKRRQGRGAGRGGIAPGFVLLRSCCASLPTRLPAARLPQGRPRIKIYRDKGSGRPKGDGLVTYLKEPSVDLALQVWAGGRFGEPGRPAGGGSCSTQPATSLPPAAVLWRAR